MFIFINDSRTSVYFFLLLRKERSGSEGKEESQNACKEREV